MDNTSAFQSKPQNKKIPVIGDNVIEQLRDIGSGVKKSLVKDAATQIPEDALRAILGTAPKSGELKPNEPITFSQEKKPDRVIPRIVEQTSQLRKMDEMRVNKQIESVRIELKALSESLKKFHSEVTKTIDEEPVNPGVYHVNFFERLKSLIKLIRSGVEDSSSWLKVFSSKKKNLGYWAMYKKKGTQFGLSSERTAATQAG